MHFVALLIISAICFDSLAKADFKEDFEKTLITLSNVVYQTTHSAKNFAKIKYDDAIKAVDFSQSYYDKIKLEALNLSDALGIVKEECRDTTQLTKLEISSLLELSTIYEKFVYNIKHLESGVWIHCAYFGTIVQKLIERCEDDFSPNCERDVIDEVQLGIKNFPKKIAEVKAEYENILRTNIAEFKTYSAELLNNFYNGMDNIFMRAKLCSQPNE